MPLTAGDVVPPKALWKFLSCAPGQDPDWETRLDQLLSGRAYFPSPRQFNDPFDCLPHVAQLPDRAALGGSLDTFIAKMKKAMPEETPAQVEEMVRWMFANVPPKTLWDMLRRSVGEVSADMGVFCLAECIDSVLMWSHYAADHTGIALRFELAGDLEGGLMPIFKVRYDTVRPQMFGSLQGDPEDEASDAVRVKAKFWEYEQEWRCVDPHAAGRMRTFNPEVITGVIFGARCTEDTKAKVRSIVGERPMEFMQARPDEHTFEMRFSEAGPMRQPPE